MVPSTSVCWLGRRAGVVSVIDAQQVVRMAYLGSSNKLHLVSLPGWRGASHRAHFQSDPTRQVFLLDIPEAPTTMLYYTTL